MTLTMMLTVALILLAILSNAGLVTDQSARNPIPARNDDFDRWYRSFAQNIAGLNTTAPGAALFSFTVTAGVLSAPVLVSGGWGYTVSGGIGSLPPNYTGGNGASITVTAVGGVATAGTIVGGGTGYLGGGTGTITVAIVNQPGTANMSLGITAAQTAAIAANYAAWHTALDNATNPLTQGRETNRLMHEARWAGSGGKRAIPGIIRPLMRMVTGYLANDSYTNPSHRVANDGMLAGLGWHVPTLERTPILPPTKGPSLSIVGYGPRSLQVEYRTVLGTLVNGRPAKQGRGKPAGVKQCQIAASIPSMPGWGTHLYNMTRSPNWIELPPEAIGQEVVLVGVWVVQKGDNRPGVSSTSAPGSPITDIVPGNAITRRLTTSAAGAAAALIGAEVQQQRRLLTQ
jgi:hypothetical protein